MINKLYRSDTDKMIAGVCGGLGEYFKIDSNIIRLVWAALLLLYGAGLFVYLIAWFIIPVRGK